MWILVEHHIRITTFPSELWKSIFWHYLALLYLLTAESNIELEKPQNLTVLEGKNVCFNLRGRIFPSYCLWTIYEMFSANLDHVWFSPLESNLQKLSIRAVLSSMLSSSRVVGLTHSDLLLFQTALLPWSLSEINPPSSCIIEFWYLNTIQRLTIVSWWP